MWCETPKITCSLLTFQADNSVLLEHLKNNLRAMIIADDVGKSVSDINKNYPKPKLWKLHLAQALIRWVWNMN